MLAHNAIVKIASAKSHLARKVGVIFAVKLHSPPPMVIRDSESWRWLSSLLRLAFLSVHILKPGKEGF
jgi:hypothetical protein